jgi:hypothetical protein
VTDSGIDDFAPAKDLTTNPVHASVVDVSDVRYVAKITFSIVFGQCRRGVGPSVGKKRFSTSEKNKLECLSPVKPSLVFET